MPVHIAPRLHACALCSRVLVKSLAAPREFMIHSIFLADCRLVFRVYRRPPPAAAEHVLVKVDRPRECARMRRHAGAGDRRMRMDSDGSVLRTHLHVRASDVAVLLRLQLSLS